MILSTTTLLDAEIQLMDINEDLKNPIVAMEDNKNMFKIKLQNVADFNETLMIMLPIVPRVGDWIDLNSEGDLDDSNWSDGATVTHIFLNPKSDIIRVIVEL